MSDRADLRSYYEEEARQSLRSAPTGRRVELRDEFIELLANEGRETVIDFGAGPGSDGKGFVDAGCRFVGLDLAHGNGVLAAEAGLTVVPGSIDAPPFRSGSFRAGWSMSTVMHVPAVNVGATVGAMAAVLEPGSPMIIGLWGCDEEAGDARDLISEGLEGQRRLFSLRTSAHNRELFEPSVTIDRVDLWGAGDEAWGYQVFWVRTPDRSRQPTKEHSDAADGPITVKEA